MLILKYANQQSRKNVYNYDIIYIDKKLNGLLIGFSIVNTITENGHMYLTNWLGFKDNEREEILKEILESAKLMEEMIFN